MEKKLMRLPFPGFYESIINDAMHTAMLDWASERAQEDVDEDEDIVYGDLYGTLNWKIFNTEVAKAYVDAVNSVFSFNFEFVEVKSPREYNFETDSLMVNISGDDLLFLAQHVNWEDLADEVYNELKPRSGFMPFYSNNLDDWPALVKDWAPAQLMLLFRTHVDEETLADQALDYMRGQGVFEAALDAALRA